MNGGKVNIGKILLLLLIPVVLVSIYFLATKNSRNQAVTDVKVSISHQTEQAMITEADVYKYLGHFGGKNYYIGKNSGDFDMSEMEKTLLSKPIIKKAVVYMGITGDLNIEIVQRNPILRILPEGRKGYYLCDDRVKIPFSRHYTPDLIPATGQMNDKVDRMLFSIVGFVNNNSFWKEQIEQFFVNENQEISFIPTGGAHEVMLGDSTDLDEKFKKLEIFYSKGLNKIGWDRYQLINLKFKGQVICK